jgi:hypothetical protein
MFLKQLVLSAAMLLSVSAFAQQAQPAAEVTGKENPQQAELLDMAGKLVKYGYEKKDALPLIQAVMIYKQLGVTDAKDQAAKTQEGTAPATGITKKDQISLNEAQILADATKFADGDKTLLALIKDAEKSTRGASGGPVRRCDTVNGNTTDIWRITFRGGEPAYVAVSGDGDTDLDLYVYDENGNLITYDNSYGDDCLVSFTPRWTGVFIIKIKNLGRVYNRYCMGTN